MEYNYEDGKLYCSCGVIAEFEGTKPQPIEQVDNTGFYPVINKTST